MRGIATEPNGGDLVVMAGGMVIAGTEAQTVEHVLLANRGEYKERPELGAELRKLQHGPGSRLWCGRARTMCRAAGVEVRRIEAGEDGKIRVE